MLRHFLNLIKFSHTIFAMPFALVGYFLAVATYGFDWTLLLKVILCMVAARTAAMAFNRLVDRKWDAKNPRTATREIPAGLISTRAVTWLVVLSCLFFVGVTYTINTTCLALSPVALLVVLGYSYTKRFTQFAHMVLGVALGIAPLGAYIAVANTLTLAPVLFGVIVLMWVSGFDIIFALQDADFDRKEGLHSIPARLGIKNALTVSALLHAIASAVVIYVGFLIEVNEIIYWIGAASFIAILCYEHIVVTPKKLDRINLAFATLNSMASVIYGTLTILAILLR